MSVSHRGPAPSHLRDLAARAAALHKAGQLSDAVALYRQIAAAAPGLPQNQYNLGLALRALGRSREAASAAQQAIRGNPDYLRARVLYADALCDLGEREAAVDVLTSGRGRASVGRSLDLDLARILAETAFTRHTPAREAAVVDLLTVPGIDPLPLGYAATTLLWCKPRFASLRRDPGGVARLASGAFVEIARDRLLQAVLLYAVVADAAFEQLVAALRDRLAAQIAGPTHPAAETLTLACALASYAANVGYLLEPGRAAPVAADADLRWLGEALYAAPPERNDDSPPPLLGAAAGTALWRRVVTDPRRERAIAVELPALTALADSAAPAVMAQYEEDPYPRWLRVTARTAEPLGAIVGRLFPHHRAAPPADGRCAVLVSGCGTGYHAARTAGRFRDADVTAIDLSRPSLAYAVRQCRDLGIGNIAFAQADIADIAGLAGWDRRFDLVEASGVLHHMADPEAGWQALCAVTRPGGYQRIGLYSVLARRDIAAAQDLVRDLPPSLEGLREGRRRLRALPADHPAAPVQDLFDTFTAAGCRDLLFNVREVRFTLPEIASLIGRLGLTFLGFEGLPRAVVAAYRAAQPADTTLTSLAGWHAFEQAHPLTFRTMYQFWCHKPAG